MWEQKSKGLFTKKAVTIPELEGRDYLIAKHGDSFHPNVQTAFDAGKPCFLFYENNPELMISSGLNPKNWPDAKNDCLKDIINDVMAGGVNGAHRGVHGVFIDCSNTVGSITGKKVDINWLTQTAKHLGDRVWDLLRIPVYFYMNMDPVNAYKDNAVDFETLHMFISQAGGISTVDWAEVTAAGYPKDIERPLLPYDDGQHWWFWFYKAVTQGIDVLCYWPKATLYADCAKYGFKASTTTPDTGTGTTPDTGTGTTPDTGTGTTPDTGTGIPESTNYQARIAIALEGINSSLKKMADDEV